MDIKRTPYTLRNVCECLTWIKLLTGQAQGWGHCPNEESAGADGNLRTVVIPKALQHPKS
jgi:hypothetical protein